MGKLKIANRPGRLFAVAIFLFTTYIAIYFGNVAFNFQLLFPFRFHFGLTPSKGFVFILTNLCYQIYCAGFILTLYTIHSRLAIMTNFLQKHEKENTESLEERVKFAAIFVDKICEVLEATKFCFAFNNTTYLLEYLFFTVQANFSLISYYLSTQSGPFDYIHVMMNVSWSFCLSYFVIWTFILSEMIKRDGKRFEKVVQNLVSKDYSQLRIHKAVQLLQLQLHHRRPIVEWDIFTIDAKLGFQLWGICLSYLIIVVQFEFMNLE